MNNSDNIDYIRPFISDSDNNSGGLKFIFEIS